MVGKTLDLVLDFFEQRTGNKPLTYFPDLGNFSCLYCDVPALASMIQSSKGPSPASKVTAFE